MGKPSGPGALSPSREQTTLKISSSLGIELNNLFYSFKTNGRITLRKSAWLSKLILGLAVIKEEKKETISSMMSLSSAIFKSPFLDVKCEF